MFPLCSRQIGAGLRGFIGYQRNQPRDSRISSALHTGQKTPSRPIIDLCAFRGEKKCAEILRDGHFNFNVQNGLAWIFFSDLETLCWHTLTMPFRSGFAAIKKPGFSRIRGKSGRQTCMWYRMEVNLFLMIFASFFGSFESLEFAMVQNDWSPKMYLPRLDMSTIKTCFFGYFVLTQLENPILQEFASEKISVINWFTGDLGDQLPGVLLGKWELWPTRSWQ